MYKNGFWVGQVDALYPNFSKAFLGGYVSMVNIDEDEDPKGPTTEELVRVVEEAAYQRGLVAARVEAGK